jgi:cold shock CspA family protein
MSETENTETTWSSETLYNGRVKWFNSKAGFGFVTVLDHDKVDEDIFVHHSGINVGGQLYKYLVQGEYVNFTLKSSDNEKYPYQAGGITGIFAGKLLCETRWENLKQKTPSETDSAKKNEPKKRYRGGGLRDNKEETN